MTPLNLLPAAPHYHRQQAPISHVIAAAIAADCRRLPRARFRLKLFRITADFSEMTVKGQSSWRNVDAFSGLCEFGRRTVFTN
ncbi:MAG: hypothetical protein ABIS15_08305 [Gemmatimonadaceae bacterium]